MGQDEPRPRLEGRDALSRRRGGAADLERLGFHLVGYGCTTCIGNSGPLPDPVADAVTSGELVVAAVLSGNRNFEGRITRSCARTTWRRRRWSSPTRSRGRWTSIPSRDPLGTDRQGEPVFLRDVWPTPDEVRDARRAVDARLFREEYAKVTEGDEHWRSMPVPAGELYAWAPSSTYIKSPPFFSGMRPDPTPPGDVTGARVLALLGDSVTTDHISPPGRSRRTAPRGRYLVGVRRPAERLHSYGARRGNHDVDGARDVSPTIRLRNQLVPDVEGGWTAHLPDGERMTIYDAAMRYRGDGVPLV